MEEIFTLALNYGLLPALFVALLFYVLKDTAKREKKYQEVEDDSRSIIEKLSDSLRIVGDIKEIATKILNKVVKKKPQAEDEEKSS